MVPLDLLLELQYLTGSVERCPIAKSCWNLSLVQRPERLALAQPASENPSWAVKAAAGAEVE